MIGFGLRLGFGLMGKNLNGNGLQIIIGLQLKAISNMKNKKIESGLARLAFELRQKQRKQKKRMKIRSGLGSCRLSIKRKKKQKEKENGLSLLGLNENNNTTNSCLLYTSPSPRDS